MLVCPCSCLSTVSPVRLSKGSELLRHSLAAGGRYSAKQLEEKMHAAVDEVRILCFLTLAEP